MPSGEEWTSNPFSAFTEQWFEAWQRANALCQQNAEGVALFWDPRLRSAWFAHLSSMLDNYMRSPAFLELMQHSLRTVTGPASYSRSQPDRGGSDGDSTTRLP